MTCWNLSTVVALDDDDERRVELVLVIDLLWDFVASIFGFIIVLRGGDELEVEVEVEVEVEAGASNLGQQQEMRLTLEELLIFSRRLLPPSFF